MSRKKKKDKGVKEKSVWSDRIFMAGLFCWLVVGVLFCVEVVWDCIPSKTLEEVPPLTGRVVDTANVMTEAGAAKVEEEIKALETETKGGQMAVLTIPSLNGAV